MRYTINRLGAPTCWPGMSACVLLASSSLPVMAQPVLPPATQLNRMAPRNAQVTQIELDTQIAYFKQEKILRSRVSLSTTEASLETVVQEVQKLVPGLQTVEVRQANAVRLTFALKDVTVRSLLQSVATLAGCQYSHFYDAIVLAPNAALTVEERAQLPQLATMSSEGRLLWGKADEVMTELKQRPDGKATIAELSRDAQQTLMALVADVQTPTSPNPHPNSIVSPRTYGTNRGDRQALLIELPAERQQYSFGLWRK